MSDIILRYDEDFDVLYLALGKPVPATVDDDDELVLVRLALSDGHPCGATIMGFRSSWSQRIDQLASVVAGKLHIPVQAVSEAFTHI